jgi:ABC-2 type transport system permease protein
MKIIFTLFFAQLKLYIRDIPVLLISFFLPLVLGIFFSLIFSNTGNLGIKLALVNKDDDQVTESMISLLKFHTDSANLSISVLDENSAMKQLAESRLDAVMILPKGMSRGLQNREKTELQVYYDPSRNAASGPARQIFALIISELNREIISSEKIFTIREEKIKHLNSSLGEFYLPNFLAISILWLGLFATALPLVLQREKLILLRFGLTPLSAKQFIGAMALWRLTVGLIQSILFLLAASMVLHIPISYKFIAVIGIALFGNLVFISLGFLIAAVSKTYESAEMITQAVNFPLMFLSGVFFIKEMLPDFMQAISYIIPLTYLGDALRQTMTGYSGYFPLWIDIGALGCCGSAFTVLALRMWRWK